MAHEPDTADLGDGTLDDGDVDYRDLHERLEQVHTLEELAAALRELHVRVDRPSLRELEQRTRTSPTPLGRSTLSDMLAGRRLPRRKVLVAFLTACQVPAAQHRPWLRAWDRLALAHARSPSPALPAHLRGQVARLLLEGRHAVTPPHPAGYHDLVVDLLRLLGADHQHDVLHARMQLADWVGHSGDPDAACEAYGQILGDYRAELGEDHPDFFTLVRHLYYWATNTREFLQDSQPEEVREGFAELLAECDRALGPDHPETLMTRQVLGYWTGQAGDPAAARDALAALVEDYLRVLGPDHPTTLKVRQDLAYWTGEAGDHAAACALLTELRSDCLRILGPDHPDTLAARQALAYWTGRAGDPAAARDAFAALMEDYLRVLGPDHPTTQEVRQALPYWTEQADGPSAPRPPDDHTAMEGDPCTHTREQDQQEG